MYTAIYLLAVVLANLSVAVFGPVSTVINAFLFIGLDLTLRDKLHDAWSGRYLWPKMGGVIFAGGALSWAISRNTGQIAVASCAAFVLSGLADAWAYQALRNQTRARRVNLSNVVGAIVDSLVFPYLAFGGFLPWIVAGQMAAKIGGGLAWYEIIKRASK